VFAHGRGFRPRLWVRSEAYPRVEHLKRALALLTTIRPGPNVIKLFTAVIYEFSYLASV
jgi:hypothetical protein